MMTAMAAGLALIPLALGGGKTGSEIQTPMAIVILCGLTTSTLLNMIVVPTLYLRYGGPERPTTKRRCEPPGDGAHARTANLRDDSTRWRTARKEIT